MDIKHKLHEHSGKTYKMQRLYKRINGKFVPVAWMCPDCRVMLPD